MLLLIDIVITAHLQTLLLWAAGDVSKILAYLLLFSCLPAGTAPFKIAMVLLLWQEL